MSDPMTVVKDLAPREGNTYHWRWKPVGVTEGPGMEKRNEKAEVHMGGNAESKGLSRKSTIYGCNEAMRCHEGTTGKRGREATAG